jgi:4-hydroxybenzoate polyprenyltransferase
MKPRDQDLSFGSRWRIYFKERFPPLQHGLVTAGFAFGTIAYSARLTGVAFPTPAAFLSVFISTFLFFLQLRILDEFKDFEDDSRWRPYRPVPRGIVSLRSLGWVWVCAAAVQTAVAVAFEPTLVAVLVLVWAYSGLMGAEFFVRDWLKAHPLVYMASHAVITPLIALYVSAFDWLKIGLPASQLGWLLAMSYFCSYVIEIGRKIRVPSDEEEGVETYSALWGHRNAVIVWLGMMTLTGAVALRAAALVRTYTFTTGYVALLLAVALILSVRFLRNPQRGQGGRFQILSAIWTLGLYLILGFAPVEHR